MRVGLFWRIATLAILIGVPLVPAAAGQEPEEMGRMTTPGGVTLSVVADKWDGTPPHLTEVIPLLVTVENNGRVPIRLTYRDFLLTGDEESSTALAASEISGHETEAVGGVGPHYPWAGYYGPYGLHSGYWYGGPYIYDPWYYPTYYVRWTLPTEDMIRKALPEQVLEPGDRIRGFLYFDDIDFDDDRGMFVANLVNAATEEPVATIQLPLEID
jgi:hypothetical protein